MAFIIGDDEANTLRGTRSNDDLEGRGGDDILLGRGGHDDIEGGLGNDVLDGGAGFNDLEGGLGDDVFVFNRGRTDIDDFGLGNDMVRISRALGADDFDALISLARTVDRGEDVLIDFGRHELLFEDTRLSDLKASDFEFV